MTAFSPDRVVPHEIRGRLHYHYRRYDLELRRFRTAIQGAFEDEVERLCRAFADGPLEAQAEPITAAVGHYVGWLGWCAWCCSHLAPPLGLTGAADARRMAAALLVYSGPRLIDDAIDDHRSYKGKRDTVLAGLATAFPDQNAAGLRGHTALIGAWIIIHGLQRLSRHGGGKAVEATLRLCRQIAPGVALEALHPKPLSWPQYRQIVELKAVRYDQILYRNLIDPVAEPDRSRLLGIAAKISALAQYLNDFVDQGDDLQSGRDNLLGWFASEADFWALCRDETSTIIAEIEALPETLGDAFAASLVETVDAAARNSARADFPTARPCTREALQTGG